MIAGRNHGAASRCGRRFIKLVKELYFTCAMKSSAVFSAFEHKRSTAATALNTLQC